MTNSEEQAAHSHPPEVMSWCRAPVVLVALLVAAVVAAGCGGDDAASDPDISDITSEPSEYVGENVELRGEVGEVFYPQGGFLLDESDGGGDDLIVYDMLLPLGVGEGDEVEVEGTVRVVDDDFREDAEPGFFDDLAFDDIEGQPAIEATAVRDPAADAVATADDFDTLDANGDSYLDRDEIAESADANGVFEVWDADADSELDRDEIAGNAFTLWDRDGDGRVSEEEWKASTDLWYPADAEFVVFDDVDGDGDSELDRDEMVERFDLSALGEAWGPGPLDKRTFKRAYFSLYDRDDDGRISKEEGSYAASAFGTPAE